MSGVCNAKNAREKQTGCEQANEYESESAGLVLKSDAGIKNIGIMSRFSAI
jgi:hypothetical protein